ncbi:MAG: family 78 glycoside hydrolase catalytic domain [Prolixibacteraceae bacterium]|nr:family 78 glycoside hydrolase catalytic domain [Prolixibacteraceae bacterium]
MKQSFFSEIFLCLLTILSVSCQKQTTKVIDLQCEYLSQPHGVDTYSPRFSWKITSEQRGVYQKAYQIIVSDNKENIQENIGNCWDSEKINSESTINIAYNGIALKSNQDYFWRVCFWNSQNKRVWSKVSFFHTGLFQPSDWQAIWVTTKEEIIDASPIFRKEFTVKKGLKQAYAFISAAGIDEFYINGKKVGDHVLDPNITDYRKTILYSAYDVTKELRDGLNAAGVMLGNGAYNIRRTKGRFSWNSNRSLGNPCFIVQIYLRYKDGSSEVISSDELWKYSWGPITFNNYYGGENYDAQKEQEGWAVAGFKDQNWENSVSAKNPGGILKSQMIPPVKVVDTISPVSEQHDSTGVYLFDLGQNIGGWWRIHVIGKAGQTIRICGAETLNDSLFSQPLKKGDRLSTKQNYHAGVWSDYTLKSDEEEMYEPRFFYSGFRYIEVRTKDKQDLKNVKIEGRVVHNALKRNGTFESSDTLINRIHECGIWSQMANTVSYPTDCPHREKGAYCGDGQIEAEASIHDFQMASFYTKWVNDMRDAQTEDGWIPNTAPTLVGGMGGGVAWGSACILVPWWMFHYYSDMRVLKETYPTMKKYIGFLNNTGKTDENPDEPYIIDNFKGYWYCLGEWCAPGEKPDGPNHSVVNTFYYYYDVLLMSKIAAILGNTSDADSYKALSDTIKDVYIKKFFNDKTYLYGSEKVFQTYQILSLVGNLIPEGYRDKVFNTLVNDIHEKEDHLGTGIIGTKCLWPVLLTGNEDELVYKIVNQTTFPGYGYWLKKGETTLLEDWHARSSHNHEMFGSVTEYFFKYLAGIQSPMEGNTSIAYSHIYLQPRIPDSLSFVNASVETIAGKVVSEWEKHGNTFRYHVNIPANTTATVVLPTFDYDKFSVKNGNAYLWKDNKTDQSFPFIRTIKKDGDQMKIEILSGDYNFVLKEEK